MNGRKKKKENNLITWWSRNQQSSIVTWYYLPTAGSKWSAVSPLRPAIILETSSLVPFIFQFPPTKNFRAILDKFKRVKDKRNSSELSGRVTQQIKGKFSERWSCHLATHAPQRHRIKMVLVAEWESLVFISIVYFGWSGSVYYLHKVTVKIGH